MSWRRHVDTALLLPAKLVGMPWWAVLSVFLAVICLRLTKQLCQFWLGRQALKKARRADVPAVTAAIMHPPADPKRAIDGQRGAEASAADME
jgi:hypothetical protein